MRCWMPGALPYKTNVNVFCHPYRSLCPPVYIYRLQNVLTYFFIDTTINHGLTTRRYRSELYRTDH